MTRRDVVTLDALCQEFYKRINEWWTAALEGRDKTPAGRASARLADRKRHACRRLTDRIYAHLLRTQGLAEAGWWKRSKAYEPMRSRVAEAPMGNWINEAWHRKDRLEQILLRQSPALLLPTQVTRPRRGRR